MDFRVEITTRAQADILELFEWIREQAPASAEEWYVGLIRKLLTLSDRPARCPVAPERSLVDREIRQLYVGRRPRDWYRALFEIEGDAVRVLRVRRCSQRELPPEALDS